MKPWLEKGAVTLYHGDALDVLRTLPDCSVQMIASSPPFWGLRNYGTGRWEGGDAEHDHDRVGARGGRGGSGAPGKNTIGATPDTVPVRECSCGAIYTDSQIGLEETPDEWCSRLVAVYRECRRVLRDDGVMFIEIGDSYSQGHGGSSTEGNGITIGKAARGEASAPQSNLRCQWCGWEAPSYTALVEHCRTSSGHTPDSADRSGGARGTTFARKGGVRNVVVGAKPKDLIGQPWLLAFALRADGWYLRSEIIWARPNPMPESVTDRPTKAHSTVFLLTKRPRYYMDMDAIRQPNTDESIARAQRSSRYDDPDVRASVPYGAARPRVNQDGGGANARSVWSIPTEPTPFAHFATWPQTLIERMIKCGTSEHGACAACGAPWRRTVDVTYEPTQKTMRDRVGVDTSKVRTGRADFVPARRVPTTTGWEATCQCNAGVRPCTVLDPFMGSGTTAIVARRLGRHAIGIELNEEYLGIARGRLSIPDEEGEVAKSRFAIEGQRGFDFDV